MSINYIYNNTEMSEREIKRLNPNVSYNDPTQVGAIPIQPTPKPTCGELERAVRDGVELDGDNTIQKWKVVDKFSDNEEATKEEQEEAYLIKLEEDRVAQLIKDVERATQEHVDSQAKELGYDDINSIAKYLTEGSSYEPECKALSLWVSECWNIVEGITDSSITVDEALALLPEYEGV